MPTKLHPVPTRLPHHVNQTENNPQSKTNRGWLKAQKEPIAIKTDRAVVPIQNIPPAAKWLRILTKKAAMTINTWKRRQNPNKGPKRSHWLEHNPPTWLSWTTNDMPKIETDQLYPKSDKKWANCNLLANYTKQKTCWQQKTMKWTSETVAKRQINWPIRNKRGSNSTSRRVPAKLKQEGSSPPTQTNKQTSKQVRSNKADLQPKSPSNLDQRTRGRWEAYCVMWIFCVQQSSLAIVRAVAVQQLSRNCWDKREASWMATEQANFVFLSIAWEQAQRTLIIFHLNI